MDAVKKKEEEVDEDVLFSQPASNLPVMVMLITAKTTTAATLSSAI